MEIVSDDLNLENSFELNDENFKKFDENNEKPKSLKIVFCIPGKTFSDDFLKSWSELLYSLPFNNIIPILSLKYNTIIYWSRNLCLNGDMLKGTKQKPFNGELDYDYIMWIDPDIIFQPNDFYKLLSQIVGKGKSIISGIYQIDHENCSAVIKWDENKFLEQGHFDFIKRNDLLNDSFKSDHSTFPLINISYNGLGFMLMKRGVMESIDYPWFEPIFKTMLTKDGLIRDFTSEDVSFCLKIKEKGIDIWVDTSIKLGHEKMRILI